MPKGTRILTVAHFDNSVNNKFNPDPTKPVFWGDQNWEEMGPTLAELKLQPAH